MTRPQRDDASGPLISVIMANYRAGRRIVRALDSVLGQTVADLEVIVSDDASGDESVTLVKEAMARDARVRLIEADSNGGPARARNRALEMARGRWIAIVDSDDIIHPERFERLLAAAAHFDADIVADDLLHFHEDGSPVRFLLGEGQRQPFQVTAEDWILAGIRPDTVPLGYLKPMVKASVLGGIRYDETLRIGEDYDLLLRVLLAGARVHVVAEPWYLYRRHSGSISHRLSAGDVEAMIGNQLRLAAKEGPFPAAIQVALDARMRGLRSSHAYEKLVDAIKARDAGTALMLLAGKPALVLHLWRSLADRRRKRAAPVVMADTRAPVELRLGAESVPAYTPAGETDWNRPSRREIWADLANRGCGRAVGVVCQDRAGLYAAGFIPADDVEIVAPFATHSPAADIPEAVANER